MGNGLAYYGTVSTGILASGKGRARQALLYPNPSNGKVYYDTGETNPEPVPLVVYDHNGELAFSTLYHQSDQLDLSLLPGGIYFVQSNYNGKIHRAKLILLK